MGFATGSFKFRRDFGAELSRAAGRFVGRDKTDISRHGPGGLGMRLAQSARPAEGYPAAECNLTSWKETSMQLHDLQDLYVDQLRDLYSAENQLVKALPKMVKAASNEQLSESFEQHLEQTRGHVDRLKQVFDKLGKKPTGKVCKAMQGLIEEAKETMEEDADPEVMDAGLIAAAQRVEHYEIAGYGTVRSFAKLLGDTAAARLLQQTLDEEGETDKKLSRLAETTINVEAARPA
jgi:ferritin-like metal-binding protein YciE